MEYIVKSIIEPDFGCEERPENTVVMDRLLLRNENGQEIYLEVSDKELYAKNINEGDWVSFALNHEIIKQA